LSSAFASVVRLESRLGSDLEVYLGADLEVFWEVSLELERVESRRLGTCDAVQLGVYLRACSEE
jgi:hypothetical protein